MAFGLDFFTLAPGLRVAGDSLAYVYKFTKKGGQGDGVQGLEVGLTDDPAIKLLETAVSGYDVVTDRDAVYTTLTSGGLTELVPGLAVGIDSLSSIETSATHIRLGLAGAQPQLQFRSANVTDVVKVGDSGYVWDLPTSTFATLKAAAESYQSDLKTKVEAMIAARIAADDTLTAAVAAQSAADVIARAAIQADVDANETASDAAELALSGRLDVLEVDPTTATALAAGDAATLSSATTYTDTAITNVIGTAPGVLDTLGEIADAINDDANVYTTLAASIAAVQTDVDGNESASNAADAALSGRIDTLEADPTTATAVAAVQADVDANETASDAAEAALSGRLDTLEADPTTATAVAAVQSDVDQNEVDADAAIAGEATTRANADTALSGRLDVLEADPTTATAVAAVQADVDSIEAAASTARTTLQTTLQNAIDAVQADVNTNESDADTAIATKLNLAGGTLTGSLVINRDFPDVELKSNGEKRVLFTDAGGGATGAIKNVSGDVDIYAGGVASGNKELSVKSTGVEVAAALTLAGGLTDAANDSAAASAGVAVNQLYRNGSVVMIRVS